MIQDRSFPLFVEKIYRFGMNDSLVGIFSEPVNPKYPSDIAVVILNSGLLHRVGIQRMSVDLARKLASIGVPAFRVDLYGIGESFSRSGVKSFRERAFDDIQETLCFLYEKTTINKFIIIGHCAGADNAHTVVVKDERVVGGIFIDGFAYPTIGFKLRDIGGSSMINPIKWMKYLTKKVMTFSPWKKENKNFMDVFGRHWPTHHDAEKEIAETIQRGAKLLYIYSGGVPIYYNHAGQFKAMFRSIELNEKVQFEYLGKADHNFTEIEYRNKAMHLIVKWTENRFLSEKESHAD